MAKSLPARPPYRVLLPWRVGERHLRGLDALAGSQSVGGSRRLSPLPCKVSRGPKAQCMSRDPKAKRRSSGRKRSSGTNPKRRKGGPQVSRGKRMSRGPKAKRSSGIHAKRSSQVSRGPKAEWMSRPKAKRSSGTHAKRRSRGPQVSRGPKAEWMSRSPKVSRGPKAKRSSGTHAKRRSRGPQVSRGPKAEWMSRSPKVSRGPKAKRSSGTHAKRRSRCPQVSRGPKAEWVSRSRSRSFKGSRFLRLMRSAAFEPSTHARLPCNQCCTDGRNEHKKLRYKGSGDSRYKALTGACTRHAAHLDTAFVQGVHGKAGDFCQPSTRYAHQRVMHKKHKQKHNITWT